MSYYTYTYSKLNDFNDEINFSQLETNIKNNADISTTFLGINTQADDVDIIFSNELTNNQENELDDLVSTYVSEEPPENKVYDRQHIMSTLITSTTASSFIDLDSMLLITKDLAGYCCYIVIFNAEISMSEKNKECEFQITVDGVSSNERIMKYSQPDKTSGQSDYNSFTMTCFLENILKDTEIKVQYRRLNSNSIIYVNRRNLIINGVRNCEIV